MSELFFEQLRIPRPDANLGVGSGSHAVQTAEVMRRFEPILLDQRPDAVVVVGDVNSTIACALTAVKLGVPVAHVEAGLRSFDRSMPEEINRLLTDTISRWLFASERAGVENLRREGVDERRIHFVGNVMIDSLVAIADAARAAPLVVDVPRGEYALLTLHRPSNVDRPEQLRALIGAVAQACRDVPIVFPVHPRTRARLANAGIDLRPPGWRVIDAVGYLEFVGLMAGARLVCTDSGGIQEETTTLAIPCVTLRDCTERPVTLDHGNRIAGTDPATVTATISAALNAPETPASRPPLWDGMAAPRIVRVLEQLLTPTHVGAITPPR
jgi:UDP-N-acetylglucosamine 2-epimerase (non-hydrolysing)